MIIKKYVVKNMNEAMTRIRYELGKDAIIISKDWKTTKAEELIPKKFIIRQKEIKKDINFYIDIGIYNRWHSVHIKK